jgi:flagellar hook-associated protein 1 FlgK
VDGFLGINIARKALETSQYGLDTTAHNIANANTPGYSKQRVILGTTEPFPAPAYNRPMLQGMLGTGVQVKSIERVRDSYFDGQIRKENQSQGYWETKDNTLKQIETIVNEPSDSSLQNLMSEFWNSWQTLSKNTESRSARSSMLENGRMLATAFNQLNSKLSSLRDNLNDQVSTTVSEVNDIAKRLAELNHNILETKSFGVQPNDAMDERDMLIDQLSKIMDIQVTDLSNSVTVVTVGGSQLVTGYGYNELEVVPNGANNGYYDIKWKVNNAALNVNGGDLKSLLDSRDTLVPGYRAELDTLANELVTQVNAVHNTGYGLDGVTGYDFFTGTSAITIALSTDVDNNPGHIAAAGTAPVAPATTPAPGDNAVALKLAQMKDTKFAIGVPPTTGTLDDYYRSFVANLGINSQESGRMVENGQSYVDLIEQHRQSVSGVSLDEEATNMVKFQRAYEAAARIISVFDQMLDTLINQMGR